MHVQRSIGWHVRRGAGRGLAIGVILAGVLLLAQYAQVASGVNEAGAGMGTGILAWFASVPFGLVFIYTMADRVHTMLGLPESSASNLVLILCLGVVANWLLLGASFGLARAWLTREVHPPAT